MSISERLKYTLENKGISPYKISVDTGVNQSTLSKILNNKTTKPQYSTLKVLAEYLQINSDWLIKGEGEPLKKNESNDNDIKKDSVVMSREVFELITSQQETIKMQQDTINKLAGEKDSNAAGIVSVADVG